MTNRGRILAFVLAAFAGVFTASPKLLAAQGAATGAIEGRVIETENSRPVSGAQITVSGTSIRATTNDGGTFRIAGVPARQVELRVRAIGFAPATQTVIVAAAQTVRADFKVVVSALQHDQVVVTGSGQQVEVKRLGNTVAVIQPPQSTPMNDISSILQAREPGLTAISSAGLTGSGARIRIRGNASLTQSNEPVIFLDGIRINSGGGQTSRLEDIDPESIERARANAQAAGLGEDRVRFQLADAAAGLDGQFDLALIVEAVHDMSDPVGVLRSVRALLKPGGTAIVADENVQESFTAPGDELERAMYGYSVLFCLPNTRADAGSVATGTVIRPATMRTYATEAGFSKVSILPIENYVFRLYRFDP